MKCCTRQHFIRVFIVCLDFKNLEGQKNVNSINILTCDPLKFKMEEGLSILLAFLHLYVFLQIECIQESGKCESVLKNKSSTIYMELEKGCWISWD